MPTLIYKRTHNGDPDEFGRFGIADCMGQVRSYVFDSVIGVGGICAEAMSEEIAGKLTWIGIGARKNKAAGYRGPIVTFDHFLNFGTEGPELRTVAPVLAKHLFVKKARYIMNFTDAEQAEVKKLLMLASDEPPSKGIRLNTSRKRRCRPAKC